MSITPDPRRTGGASAALIAVPDGVVDELTALGLVEEVPTLRGPVFDAVLSIGPNAAVLVSLMQAPDTIKSFSAWLKGFAAREGSELRVRGRSGGKEIDLRVTADRELPVDAVADFILAALSDGARTTHGD